MKKQKITIEEFKEKMDWEGGFYELAFYGLEPREIADEELKELWDKYLQHFEEMKKAEELLNYFLEENDESRSITR